jgi:tetratricopeptide (TPR) repeat protein
MAALTAITLPRARQALVRAHLDLGRLEVKEKNFAEAERILMAALADAKDKCGEQSQEAASLMASLSSCYKQAGDVDRAIEMLEKLYELTPQENTPGKVNEGGLAVCKGIQELYEQKEAWAEAAEWAAKALAIMQTVVQMKYHPVLEPFFDSVIDLKTKAGDAAGAEEVKKQLLKAKAQLQGAASRKGMSPGAAAAAAAQQQQGGGPGGKKGRGGRGKR